MKACHAGRSVELDVAGGSLVIRFPYDVALLAVVRALPGRRFDTHAKCWRCPLDAAATVLAALAPLRFTIAPEVAALAPSRDGSGS